MHIMFFLLKKIRIRSMSLSFFGCSPSTFFLKGCDPYRYCIFWLKIKRTQSLGLALWYQMKTLWLFSLFFFFWQFLFEAATANCVELATDRHGCCVLQKCLSHSDGEQRRRLVCEITSNSLILSQDPFGYPCLFLFFFFFSLLLLLYKPIV